MRSLAFMLCAVGLCAMLIASGGTSVAQTDSSRPAAKPPVFTDPAEYNAYIAAMYETRFTAQANALEKFIAEYPNSVMVPEAREVIAYDQAMMIEDPSGRAAALEKFIAGHPGSDLVDIARKAAQHAREQAPLSSAVPAPPTGSAPTQRGSLAITGTVKAADGARIPKAELTLTGRSSKEQARAVSSQSGSFTFAGLAPGEYSLTVSAPGFRGLAINSIPLQASRLRLALELEVGDAGTVLEKTWKAYQSQQRAERQQEQDQQDNESYAGGLPSPPPGNPENKQQEPSASSVPAGAAAQASKRRPLSPEAVAAPPPVTAVAAPALPDRQAAGSGCDDFCQKWRQVWAARDDNFRSIQGRRREVFFDVSAWLPGASDCYLGPPTGERKYVTYWCEYKNLGSESKARSAYEEMKTNISRNLPAGWTTSENSTSYYVYFKLWGPDETRHGEVQFHKSEFVFSINGVH